jgi:hypothetical protein
MEHPHWCLRVSKREEAESCESFHRESMEATNKGAIRLCKVSALQRRT